MKLPNMRYADGITKGQQVQFGGLNHNLGAGDGELWDMRNLTSDYAPLLATRAPRWKYKGLGDPGGIFSWDGLAWVDGTGFFYKGQRKGTVTAGKKTFAALGAYIVILPDKAYYNTMTGEFGSLEAKWSGTRVTFTNGKLYGEAAEANAIQVAGVNWADYFKPGDAVTISGCTKHKENNKTPIIREIDGDKLYFYEYVFTLEGSGGTTAYAETGNLTIQRTVPDLRFICENENRLWGCDGNTIYASKLGDIFNWNVYDGVETDSFAVDTGSAGEFTGCISFLGYPIFFKEDHIYKVYGSIPSNFEVMGSATLGVAAGSSGSLAIAGETLFYLSRAGIMAYSGGIPQPVGAAFGLEQYKNAAAGSDGLKYFVSMQGEDRMWGLYVYDTQRGMWHKEDNTHATHFAQWGGNLYMMGESNDETPETPPITPGGEDDVPAELFGLSRPASMPGIWVVGRPRGVAADDAGWEEPFRWEAEFGDFTEGNPNKKGVSKIQIRLELDEGAEVQVLIQFDTDGAWQKVSSALGEGVKRSYYLPIIPRRGDHYRLKLEGVGGCRVYSMVREYYSGSELKSKPGRQ